MSTKLKKRIRTPAPARAAEGKKTSAAVQREVAETKRRGRTGEAARETSARITRGEEPTQALADTTRGTKRRGGKKARR